MTVDDELIIDELINSIHGNSMFPSGITLFRVSSEGPTTLTSEYRITELQKFRSGLPSEWAETELKAERNWRAHKSQLNRGEYA